MISATPQLLEDHKNVAGVTSELEVCLPCRGHCCCLQRGPCRPHTLLVNKHGPCDAQRGRQDAESAVESVAGLRSACAGALPALEGHVSAAMEALTGLHEAQRSASWSATLLSNLTPQFLQGRGSADTPAITLQRSPSKGVG